MYVYTLCTGVEYYFTYDRLHRWVLHAHGCCAYMYPIITGKVYTCKSELLHLQLTVFNLINIIQQGRSLHKTSYKYSRVL